MKEYTVYALVSTVVHAEYEEEAAMLAEARFNAPCVCVEAIRGIDAKPETDYEQDEADREMDDMKASGGKF